MCMYKCFSSTEQEKMCMLIHSTVIAGCPDLDPSTRPEHPRPHAAGSNHRALWAYQAHLPKKPWTLSEHAHFFSLIFLALTWHLPSWLVSQAQLHPAP